MLTLNPKPRGEDDDGKPKPPTQAEKGFAVLAHLSGAFWLPIMGAAAILALLIPFLTLQFARIHSEYVEQHAVQAMNFQLLMGCFYVVALLMIFVINPAVLPPAIPLWWVGIGSLLFSLWEGAKAVNGWPSRYPLSIKLFK